MPLTEGASAAVPVGTMLNLPPALEGAGRQRLPSRMPSKAILCSVLQPLPSAGHLLTAPRTALQAALLSALLAALLSVLLFA